MSAAHSKPGQAPWPQRLPGLMVLLAIPSILIGFVGAVAAMNTLLGETLGDRRMAVEQVRDQFVSLQRGAHLPPQPAGAPPGDVNAVLRLPAPDVERLGARLGDELYERRGALIPLALMNLVLCWLLLTGAVGTVRRREFGAAMWRWAALANVPFAGLSMVVTVVRTRAVTAAIAPAVAEALAAVSKRTLGDELQAVHDIAHEYLLGAGLWYAGSAFLFTLTALYLRRAAPVPDLDS